MTKYVFTAIFIFAAFGINQSSAEEASPVKPIIDCYISTGDNWWIGDSLAVDSPASIDAAFDMFKNVLGVKRVYWRGLQASAWAHTPVQTYKSYRYASFHKYMQGLIKEKNIEKIAADIAHSKGMELWGVGSIADWGSSPDTPTFGDYPFEFESTLRTENPQWVPVDKHGYRRQGGTIELAYPEARKAMIDLQTRIAAAAGYDGVIFITYAENFSTRFNDEFGYSEPIVTEFKKRYGIDITKEEFNKFASREDWYRLRGEYLTAYLREMKESMGKHGIKTAMFLQGCDPRKPMVWATLPQMHYTFGNIYFDLETWAQQEVVDELIVYGATARISQVKAINDVLWLTRGTNVKVGGFVTSGLEDPNWKPFYQKGIPAVLASWEDQSHFELGMLPHQDISILETGGIYEKMKFLSQVIEGKSTAPASQIIPLASHDNVLMRRMAIFALGKLKAPEAVEVIENALFDVENGVRCKATQALQYNNRPESVDKIFAALVKHGNHPLAEGAVKALPKIEPFQFDKISAAAAGHENEMVRQTAIKVLGYRINSQNFSVFKNALNDPDGYVRYLSASALAGLKTADSINTLIEAATHDDVVVQGRAAISLGIVSKGLNAETISLRPAMLESIQNMFLKMGDGCDREDKDYGYRMAGDGLLAFTADGEAFLQQCLDQDSDKRLAELAWRVLYYRETDGENRFNIITEKENDAAFSKRPILLKTLRAERLVQNFDRIPLDSAGLVGVASNVNGRWGSFISQRVTIDTEKAYSKPNSVKISGRNSQLLGWNSSGVLQGNDYEISFMVYRQDNDSAFTFRNKSSNSSDYPLTIKVDKSGALSIQAIGSPVVVSEFTIKPDVWTKITAASDINRKICTVSVQDMNTKDIYSVKVEIPSNMPFALLEFLANESTVNIDDVEVVEKK